jgi:hypothetical protein
MGKMKQGKDAFKILIWGPEGPVNVWTVPYHRINELVKKAIFTIRKSHFNEFVGFSVMRNMTLQELERLSKQQDGIEERGDEAFRRVEEKKKAKLRTRGPYRKAKLLASLHNT